MSDTIEVPMLKAFRNKNFVKRNYECTNVVACLAYEAPNNNYEQCGFDIIENLTHLYTKNGVRYFGHL